MAKEKVGMRNSSFTCERIHQIRWSLFALFRSTLLAKAQLFPENIKKTVDLLLSHKGNH